MNWQQPFINAIGEPKVAAHMNIEQAARKAAEEIFKNGAAIVLIVRTANENGYELGITLMSDLILSRIRPVVKEMVRSANNELATTVHPYILNGKNIKK